MTMTDTILFVKETQTCHYVLHIATARLCGEPGFRSRRDTREEAYVRCREVVTPEQHARTDSTLPEADHPFKMPPRAEKPVIAPAPPPAEEQEKAKEKGDKAKQNDAIRRAIEKLIQSGDLKPGEVTIVEEGDEEVVIEFLDYGEDAGVDGEQLSVHELLLNAGLGVRMEPSSEASDEGDGEGQDEDRQGDHEAFVHDEL